MWNPPWSTPLARGRLRHQAQEYGGDFPTERFEGAAHGCNDGLVFLPARRRRQARLPHNKLLAIGASDAPARCQDHFASYTAVKPCHLDYDLVVNRGRARPGGEDNMIGRDEQREVLRQHPGKGVL